MAERAVRAALNLEVAGSNPIRSKVLQIPGLFRFFISIYIAAFLSCSGYGLRSAALPLCKLFNRRTNINYKYGCRNVN